MAKSKADFYIAACGD